MKTISKQPIQAFFLGIMISIGITLTGATIAAVSLAGSASVSFSEANLNISGTNGATSTSASLATSTGPTTVNNYTKTRYYQQGTMTREKYDDGCYYNFNNVDMSDDNTLNQTKTGALHLTVVEPDEVRIKVEEIIKKYVVSISRENATKNSYEVIIQTPIDQFEDIVLELSGLVEDKANIEKITCSENVTIPMTNTRNDLQKMQIWADRYKRVFDFKVAEFDRAHESELVRKLRELETAEATYQKYQQQVDALQERADFLKNMSTHATISILIVETTEKAVKEKDLGEWLMTLFTGQDEV